MEPDDIIAVRDRPLTLNCQVEGEGPITITWRRNGVPVAAGVRTAILANGTLLIRNFSKRRESNETDAGEYECAAQNRYGMLISRKAHVRLACEFPPPIIPVHKRISSLTTPTPHSPAQVPVPPTVLAGG